MTTVENKHSPLPLLEVSELLKLYGGRCVVNRLSYLIYLGEVVGLLGPNGAGKTTAFYMAMGLVKPDSGSIYFSGQEITRYPIHKRARMGMGYLAQEPSVFHSLTVEENILCLLENLPLEKSEKAERLEELLQELHLEQLRTTKASALSGGERRRLEITRVLATRPKLLLLDEPFANIDPLSIADVKQIIRHLKSRGISVLITDHNAREILSIVDRCYLIYEGQAMLSGTPEELVRHNEARERYLGHDFRL